MFTANIVLRRRIPLILRVRTPLIRVSLSEAFHLCEVNPEAAGGGDALLRRVRVKGQGSESRVRG